MIAEIIGGIVSCGVGKLIGEASAQFIPEAASKFTKLACKIGVASIGAAIGICAKEYAKDQLDEIHKSMKAINDVNQAEAKEEEAE